MARRNKKRIYSIIFINHGKQLKTLYSEETEEKIYKRFGKLLKENKKIIFPMRYNNEKHVMVESEHEIAIIKCKEIGDHDVNKIKDSYGKYVNYETSDEDWIIIDRADYDVEETFWVYGYHPKLQRKTFQWIFDNIITRGGKDKNMFKSIQVFYNKILVECNNDLDIIICKNKNDSIRFYNQTEEWCKSKKFKNILFIGDISKSAHKSNIIQKIKKLTNWSNKKIRRPSTRP